MCQPFEQKKLIKTILLNQLLFYWRLSPALKHPGYLKPFAGFGAGSFHIGNGFGYWTTKNAMTVFCYQDVVFDANTSEIFVSLYLIIIHEIFK